MGLLSQLSGKAAKAYFLAQAEDLGLFLFLAVQIKGVPVGRENWLALMKAAVGYVAQHGTPTWEDVRDALK